MRPRRPSASPRQKPSSRSSADGYDDLLDCVVRVAAEIPGRLVRLLVALRVARAGTEHVRAGLRLPAKAPAAPGPALPRRVELCRRPRHTAVGAELDRLDRRVSRPGTSLDHVLAGLGAALAGEELRNPRRREQRTRHDPLDRRALLVLGLAKPVALCLLVAAERLVDRLDRGEPFDA